MDKMKATDKGNKPTNSLFCVPCNVSFDLKNVKPMKRPAIMLRLRGRKLESENTVKQGKAVKNT
jgi:hypothetical protein